CLQYASYPWTF
nr:immunoglobulin light chain junction region [Mus musculus]NSL99008.1 immunoglobulin light chain junction region [Mus musculus]NSM02251.1 immunoglobulin light chain junction region [Mus musculus]NSM02742.1 immunoglobulin light chain junction region [Mus musculus]